MVCPPHPRAAQSDTQHTTTALFPPRQILGYFPSAEEAALCYSRYLGKDLANAMQVQPKVPPPAHAKMAVVGGATAQPAAAIGSSGCIGRLEAALRTRQALPSTSDPTEKP